MDPQWAIIPGYPNYMINAYGEVYNKRYDKIMALSKTMQGDLK